LVIVSVASSKGGVGKTTIISNLGVILGERGKRTLLVDADLASGNLAYYSGLRNPTPTLHELLSGRVESVEEVARKISETVTLLPSGTSLRGFLDADLNRLRDFLPDYAENYDITLIDCPPGISKNSVIPIDVSDQVLLIATPDEASVSAAENVAKLGGLLGREVKGCIVNRRRRVSFFGRMFGEDTQIDPADIKTRIGTEILGVVPEDENVKRATEIGKPVILYKPKCPASKAIREISSKFI